MVHQWDDWREKLSLVIESKVEEWKMYGHESVTEEDVWNSFKEKLKRHKDIPEDIRIHWVTAQLFSLSANDYMTQLTVSAYRGEDWFSSEGPFDLEGL